MNFHKSIFAGAGLLLIFGTAGCGLITPHADCDQVAQQQRGGATDAEVAKATGYTVDQVQSCSQTGSSGGRETANNYQDQPRLPAIPVTIPTSILSGVH